VSERSGLHLIVFSDTFFEINGVRTFYRTLLDWCRRTNYARVTVICPEPSHLNGHQVPENVIPIRPLGRFREPLYNSFTLGHYPISMLRDLFNSLDGTKVIHVATSGPLGYAGSVLARRQRIPCVGCYNTDLPRYGGANGRKLFGRPGQWMGTKIMHWFDKFGYRYCDAMCVPSASAAQSAGMVFSGPIRVIPYPLDVDRFRPAPARTGSFRDRYGRNGAPLVAVIGRLGPEKNLDLVCRHMARDERINLVFVGDGAYAPVLRNRWNVTVTGFLHGQDLLEAYQQADVFVQLSVTETFGLCLAEALACGLPSFVLKSPGLAATLPPGEGIEVLEERELPTLTDRCVKLVADGKRHEEASRRARELVMPYSPDVVLPKFLDFHRSFAR